MKSFGTYEIKTPVWIAASRLTENIKSIEECCKKGAEGIVFKGTDGRLSQPCDRKCQKCKFPNSFNGRKLFVKKPIIYSFTPNTLLCEFLSLKELKFFLSFLKKNYPGVIRVANISGKNPEEFIEAAKILQKCGVQILELNTKYTIRYKDSNAPDNKKYILYFLKKITKEIKIPLIMKVCSDFDLLTEMFLKDVSKYVKGLTITDGKSMILPPYLRKRLPKGIEKKTCAIAGEPLWKLVKKYVPIAKRYVDFVSASGGIYNSQRAKKIIALGADAVQLCSGIEFFGYDLIEEIVKKLNHKY